MFNTWQALWANLHMISHSSSNCHLFIQIPAIKCFCPCHTSLWIYLESLFIKLPFVMVLAQYRNTLKTLLMHLFVNFCNHEWHLTEWRIKNTYMVHVILTGYITDSRFDSVQFLSSRVFVIFDLTIKMVKPLYNRYNK